MNDFGELAGLLKGVKRSNEELKQQESSQNATHLYKKPRLTRTTVLDPSFPPTPSSRTDSSLAISSSPTPLFPSYPPPGAPVKPLPPASPLSLPFAPPSNLAANQAGHVFPSAYNALTVNTPQLPAKMRIFAHGRPDLPWPAHWSDRHGWSGASTAQLAELYRAIPENKTKRWGAALKSYHEWCSMEGIKDEDCLPVTTIKIQLYLASQLSLFRVETIKKRVADLKEALLFWHIPWEVQDDHLSPYYSALRATQPHPKLKRPPFLARHALLLIDHVKSLSPALSDPFHVAMLALTLTGFGGLMRSGECTFSKLKPDELERRKKVRVEHLSRLFETDTPILKLPWDKTHLWEGREVAIADFGLNTAFILQKHITLSDLSPHDHLFSYRAGRGKKKGEVVFITKTSWKSWIDKALTALNKDKISGHSLRIGGATQLLLNGVEPQVVQAAGSWSSDSSFQKYWRHASALIAAGKISNAVDVPEVVEFRVELRSELEFL